MGKKKQSKKGYPRRDWWDKFGSISNFFASVVIAGASLYITSAINTQQSERDADLKEEQLKNEGIDIVSKFMGSLKGSRQEKELALLSIQSLGKTKLAINLALSFPDSISLEALGKMAYNAKPKDLDLIYDALFQVRYLGGAAEVDTVIEKIITRTLLRTEELYKPHDSLDVSIKHINSKQAQIGKLLTDAMLNAAIGIRPDIAILKSGLIHPREVKYHRLTYADVGQLLPNDVDIKMVTIKGKKLTDVLESNKNRKGTDDYLQISNCDYNLTDKCWELNGMPIDTSNQSEYYVLVDSTLLKVQEFQNGIIERGNNSSSFYRTLRYSDLRSALIFHLHEINRREAETVRVFNLFYLGMATPSLFLST